MGWDFGLCVECCDRSGAEAIAQHFDKLELFLWDGRKCNRRVYIYQTEDRGLIDWWCCVNILGIDEYINANGQNTREMTELSLLLYQHLRSSPSFRYALVGVEVDEFRYYHELLPSENDADINFIGLVISEEIYQSANQPIDFITFRPGYFWKPL